MNESMNDQSSPRVQCKVNDQLDRSLSGILENLIVGDWPLYDVAY